MLTTSAKAALVTEIAHQGSSAETGPRPASVQDLVKAWKLSGRKAQVLEHRLLKAVGVARRYRRDLLRLAEQNRFRKVQAENLQKKILELLERGVPVPPPTQELPPLEEGDEVVPAAYVRQLLVRLREAHDLVGELETLLEYRERQVHGLLASRPESPELAPDWRLVTLQRELTDARHRIRLLTQELTRRGEIPDDQQQSRIAELESRLQEVLAQGDQALQEQLRSRSDQIEQLQGQVLSRQEELKKAAATIQAARDRIQVLERDLQEQRGGASQEETSELLNEITSLQDEIARLQDENEGLALRRGGDPEMEARLQALEVENAQLKVGAERVGRLEAALVDFRQKLQLAGSKYQEVKAALIEKHQQLVELQGRSQESEKKGEFLEPLVRTLESALEDTRRQNAALQKQLEEARKSSGAPAVSPDEALASMENKLKEARRSAVRAQAEAGLKRKEVAKLQQEVAELQAKVVALGGSL